MLSHSINLSVGVALLFSTATGVKILHREEIVKSHLLMIKAEIKGLLFYFINVYAPNFGPEHVVFLSKLCNVLKQCDNEGCFVLGVCD